MFYLTLYLAKLTNFIIRFFKLGVGFTWPGHLALKLFPGILSHPNFKFPLGSILISGTNGKTTTSKLLTHIFESNNLKVVHNKTGANLLNGIVSSILLSMDMFGKHHADIGVFEVDENNLPLALNFISPNVLVLLNLTRDQLDRYGEVDIILEKWIDSIRNLDSTTEIVLDATQNYFNQIKSNFAGDITYFDGTREHLSHTKLVGDFNAKNVNAAVYTAVLVGVDEDKAIKCLKDFNFAYGRGETIINHNKEYQILLAKNPASFNNNLEAALNHEFEFDTILFILNDNIPDGRDVSWIYDINHKELERVCRDKNIFVCGSRYLDMCVRLYYAGVSVSEQKTYLDIAKTLQVINKDATVENILVLPNYSAMLFLRKELVGRSIL